MRKRNARFGQADKFNRLLRRDRQRQRFRIGQTDVFAGENYDATRNEAEVLAGVQHFRKPVHRVFLIGCAHALNKRADRVVMCVARAIVNDRLLLNAFFCHRDREMNDAFRIRRRGQHANLKRVQTFACVAIAQLRQMFSRILVDLHVVIAEPAFFVG